MQNKGAIWVFTILLTLACLYQLSFSFYTRSFEKKAKTIAAQRVDSVQSANGDTLALLEQSKLLDHFETKYLSDHAGSQIYPIFDYTYQECKEKELNLGLDLAGGMSVTLELSLPDLVISESNNNKDPGFRKAIADAEQMQDNSQDNFITLFGEAWDKDNPGRKLAAIFNSRDNQEKFPRDATNAEILTTLHEDAKVAINNTEKILRTRIDKFGVAQPNIQKQQISGRIQIELPGVKDKDRVRKVIQSTANLEFWDTFENSEVLPYLEKANQVLSQDMYPNLGINSDTTKTDTSASKSSAKAASPSEKSSTDSTLADTTSKNLLQELGTDSAKNDSANQAQNNSLEEQRKKYPLFSVLRPAVDQNKAYPGPVVGYAALKDTAAVNKMLKNPDVQNIFPAELELLWSAKPDTKRGNVMELYAIKKDTRNGKAPLDGSVIVDARQQYDPTGEVEVSMTMNSDGARIWKKLTAAASSQNPKRSIAIVLDNYVYSAPRVISEIPTGQSSISMGNGSRTDQIQEAQDLSNLLKAGALPAPARIVDEEVVGPSLGQANIHDGLISFLIALAVVIMYMVLYYKGAGLIADLALLANLFFLLGALASIQASLTLPGIAGIVLTIGMAVDANVLIFERVKEELRNHKTIKAALREGYSKAYSAIIDSNLTTLLTAFVLLLVGSGPIKGFATTLIIGLFSSLFSAIFITRLIFDRRLRSNGKLTFWMKWSKNVLHNANYNFVGKRKFFYFLSGTVFAICFGSIIFRGFNFGVDFTGGRTYTVKFDKVVPLNQMRSGLSHVFIDKSGNALQPEVKVFGSANQVMITTKFLVNDKSKDADGTVETDLRKGLDTFQVPYTIVESRKVDPSISDDFQRSSTEAVIIAVCIIFLYIFIRFRRWQYGLGAIVAMMHDVIITLGIYSLLYGHLPFSLEIDEAFIAAILTVLGYSVNDTVIVFDRIREFVREHPKESLSSVINSAINSTLTRTLNTSMTTMFVLLVIFIFGGESIRGFVFALLIGVFVGTYSSIYIASPIVIDLAGKNAEKAKKALEKTTIS